MQAGDAIDEVPGAIIELELVDKVPGAGGRETAKQAYRLRTQGNTLHLIAATEQGLIYAVYGLLEDHFGVHFYDFPRGRADVCRPGL